MANGLDIFGHPVSVNYQGSEAYSTHLSTFCSVAVLTLMIINLVMLSLGYRDGIYQEEKTTFVQVDRVASEAYNLGASDFEMVAVFTQPELMRLPQYAKIAETFEIAIYQKHPCDVNADECEEDEYLGAFGNCSKEKRADIERYQVQS